MNIPARLRDWHDDFRRWRRDLHAHPETAFEEHYTSDFVARRLDEFGVEVHRGLAGTGVVGTLRGDQDGPTVGLRADMDALAIHEQTGLPYASRTPGKMHACGHDGHTTMLLAAARYLAETKRFRGTVHFIFQPAEENEGGGRVMIEQGLFEQFPCDEIYGMHNWPGLAVGHFAVRPGPIMAAFDLFEVTVRGRGSHAAKPQISIDPIVTASHLVAALQTIASRTIDPVENVVVSVTQIAAGDTWNVIPETAVLRGTTRSFMREVQDTTEASLRRICRGVATAFGAEIDLRYERRYPPTVNHPQATETAARAAVDVVGDENLNRDPPPSMGAEDFSFMLANRPGCYIWVGNGPVDGQRVLHNPHYDFNDDVIPYGAAYWIRLVGGSHASPEAATSTCRTVPASETFPGVAE